MRSAAKARSNSPRCSRKSGLLGRPKCCTSLWSCQSESGTESPPSFASRNRPRWTPIQIFAHNSICHLWKCARFPFGCTAASGTLRPTEPFTSVIPATSLKILTERGNGSGECFTHLMAIFFPRGLICEVVKVSSLPALMPVTTLRADLVTSRNTAGPSGNSPLQYHDSPAPHATRFISISSTKAAITP